ncbi:hypothetical protein CAPTEDRAFT_194469, partial [Capitella teleta]
LLLLNEPCPTKSHEDAMKNPPSMESIKAKRSLPRPSPRDDLALRAGLDEARPPSLAPSSLLLLLCKCFDWNRLLFVLLLIGSASPTSAVNRSYNMPDISLSRSIPSNSGPILSTQSFFPSAVTSEIASSRFDYSSDFVTSVSQLSPLITSKPTISSVIFPDDDVSSQLQITSTPAFVTPFPVVESSDLVSFPIFETVSPTSAHFSSHETSNMYSLFPSPPVLSVQPSSLFSSVFMSSELTFPLSTGVDVTAASNFFSASVEMDNGQSSLFPSLSNDFFSVSYRISQPYFEVSSSDFDSTFGSPVSNLEFPISSNDISTSEYISMLSQDNDLYSSDFFSFSPRSSELYHFSGEIFESSEAFSFPLSAFPSDSSVFIDSSEYFWSSEPEMITSSFVSSWLSSEFNSIHHLSSLQQSSDFYPSASLFASEVFEASEFPSVLSEPPSLPLDWSIFRSDIIRVSSTQIPGSGSFATSELYSMDIESSESLSFSVVSSAFPSGTMLIQNSNTFESSEIYSLPIESSSPLYDASSFVLRSSQFSSMEADTSEFLSTAPSLTTQDYSSIYAENSEFVSLPEMSSLAFSSFVVEQSDYLSSLPPSPDSSSNPLFSSESISLSSPFVDFPIETSEIVSTPQETSDFFASSILDLSPTPSADFPLSTDASFSTKPIESPILSSPAFSSSFPLESLPSLSFESTPQFASSLSIQPSSPASSTEMMESSFDFSSDLLSSYPGDSSIPSSIDPSEMISLSSEIIPSSSLPFSITPSSLPITTSETRTTPKPPTPYPEATTELNLNISDAFDEFWLRTVVAVSEDEEVTSVKFQKQMESNLASLFNEAIARDYSIVHGVYFGHQGNGVGSRRTKRAVTNGNATIQITRVKREEEDRVNTVLLYYLVENQSTNITDASRSEYLLHLFSEQETAIRLGYPVILQGERYVPLPDPPDKKLWIIGAVLGGLVLVGAVVWCVLFLYFKCNRAPSSPRRSPRARKVEGGEMKDSLTYSVKDFAIVLYRKLWALPLLNSLSLQFGRNIGQQVTMATIMVTKRYVGKQGFDFVRSEVGMESEMYQMRPPDYFRRNVNGSSELEGMYTPCENTPPPKYPSRPHPPGRPSNLPQKRPPPPRPPPQRIVSSGEESSDYGDKKPLKKPGKIVDHMEQGGWGTAPVVRSSQHAIRLPPLNLQNVVTQDELNLSQRDHAELNDSLRQRADVERHRNKQRQREKNRPLKSTIAFLSIDDAVPEKPKRKKKKKKSAPVDENGYAVPSNHINESVRLPASSEEDDTGEDPSIEHARQRMHALLDEAFALANPKQLSSRHVSPRQSGIVNESIEEEPPEVRHTPMHNNPPPRRENDYANTLWKPYEAADEAAKIHTQALSNGIHTPHGNTDAAPFLVNAVATPLDYTSVRLDSSMLESHGQPRSHPPPPTSAFLPYPTQRSDEYDSLPQMGSLRDRLLASRSLDDSLGRSGGVSNHFVAPSPPDSDDDEVDIINNVMAPGVSSEPLVQSIREELQRLSRKSRSQTPGFSYTAKP